MSDFLELIEDIDRAVYERFGALSLPFKLIGRVALELAGLPERGTKDIDALEEALRIKALSEEELTEIEGFLNAEFGKGSPGDRRYGLYLDLVAKGVAWLPRKPRFLEEKHYTALMVSHLHPADVCVSKTFSHFKRKRGRGSDRTDIIEALEANLFEVNDYLRRLDESLPLYETHAEAPELFPRALQFIVDEIIPTYGNEKSALTYELPSWMENM